MPPTPPRPCLCGLIERETHPNVCAAAVDVLTELGTPDAFPALRDARRVLPARLFCHSPSRLRSLAFQVRKASAMASHERPAAALITVTPEDVLRFCEFVYRRTGMSIRRQQALLRRQAA